MRPLVLVALLVGCKPEPEAPTFSAVRDDILVPSCGFSSCHGSGTGDLQIDADTAYENLVDVASAVLTDEILVIPGDPDNSYLVKKIEGAPGIEEDPMPPPSGGLDAADIEMVRAWIAAGAAND